jgi:hypothetical protein
MSSKQPPEPDRLDLQRDLPVTPEDVEALRRLRHPRPSPEEFRLFMEWIGHASIEDLRRRKGPRGEPFEL